MKPTKLLVACINAMIYVMSYASDDGRDRLWPLLFCVFLLLITILFVVAAVAAAAGGLGERTWVFI